MSAQKFSMPCDTLRSVTLTLWAATQFGDHGGRGRGRVRPTSLGHENYYEELLNKTASFYSRLLTIRRQLWTSGFLGSFRKNVVCVIERTRSRKRVLRYMYRGTENNPKSVRAILSSLGDFDLGCPWNSGQSFYGR